MNIANPIPGAVELKYHKEVWQQALDYEHIPFRCKKCHEYGHLYKECPLNAEEEERKTKQQRKNTEDNEGFQEIKNRKRPAKETPKDRRKEPPVKTNKANRFEILQVEEENSEIRVMDYQEEKEQEGRLSQDTNSTKQKTQRKTGERQKNKRRINRIMK